MGLALLGGGDDFAPVDPTVEVVKQEVCFQTLRGPLLVAIGLADDFSGAEREGKAKPSLEVKMKEGVVGGDSSNVKHAQEFERESWGLSTKGIFGSVSLIEVGTSTDE